MRYKLEIYKQEKFAAEIYRNHRQTVADAWLFFPFSEIDDRFEADNWREKKNIGKLKPQ